MQACPAKKWFQNSVASERRCLRYSEDPGFFRTTRVFGVPQTPAFLGNQGYETGSKRFGVLRTREEFVVDSTWVKEEKSLSPLPNRLAVHACMPSYPFVRGVGCKKSIHHRRRPNKCDKRPFSCTRFNILPYDFSSLPFDSSDKSRRLTP
jgi:hypothetical protein